MQFVEHREALQITSSRVGLIVLMMIRTVVSTNRHSGPCPKIPGLLQSSAVRTLGNMY